MRDWWRLSESMVSPPQLRSVAQQSLSRAQSLHFDYVPTSGQPRDTPRDTNPCPRELDFGMEELKISKKALDNILEYLFTTQIREGFSLDSNLSVVGWIETVQGNQYKNRSLFARTGFWDGRTQNFEKSSRQYFGIPFYYPNPGGF